MSASLVRVRKLLPGILVCVAVVLIGIVPFVKALGAKVDSVAYTSDVLSTGGFIPYELVAAGKELCVPDAELPEGARFARVFVRSSGPAEARIRLIGRQSNGTRVLSASVREPLGGAGEARALEIPVRVGDTVGRARVCARNAGKRAVEVGVGQVDSVGFADAPERPLLRLDLLEGPPEARIDRLGHALRVATYFKSSVVGRGLLIGVGVLALGAVLALGVVTVRRRDLRDQRPSCGS